jgi:hypothetical protein
MSQASRESTLSDVSAFYQRAWYGASIADFRAALPEEVLGRMVAVSPFAVDQTQRDAWVHQIRILQMDLEGLSGAIFLEFEIPRMGRRIDAVLVIGPALLVLEFKVGQAAFDRAGIDQVWDYALDLKNFHLGSHDAVVVPMLIATEAKPRKQDLHRDVDNVFRPLLVHGAGVRQVIDQVLAEISGTAIDAEIWAKSPYRPTPTIVEAARTLYAQHSVEAIARFDAGATNLAVTSHRVEKIVAQARSDHQKVICFITGVPGAGKTLVGLNVATHRRQEDDPTHAVFLSGNGPLVAVLREALARDEVARSNGKVKKGRAAEGVKAFIQNVHHFRDDALVDLGAPDEHVVIFDEAQRAWNRRQTANFMQRKKGKAGFTQSEPEFLISCMDRHSDWSVIVCLVGGGQEINTGEDGIGAWIDAIRTTFPDWRVHISDRLTDSEYAAGEALTSLQSREHVAFDKDLHLAVSMRSFRAEHVSAFVKAMLDCEKSAAKEALASIMDRYPIALTRDLRCAKEWIRSRARGSERFGLVTSSKALRLKPHAIDVRVKVDPVNWFLNDKDDVRSSYYLEDPATEFQVQGLELDWTCVTWDADLRHTGKGWTFHDFRGSKWMNVKSLENRNYLRNAYRVLLTRARQGMVIFVPTGDPLDATRKASFYDPTYSYLSDLGIPEFP